MTDLDMVYQEVLLIRKELSGFRNTLVEVQLCIAELQTRPCEDLKREIETLKTTRTMIRGSAYTIAIIVSSLSAATAMALSIFTLLKSRL